VRRLLIAASAAALLAGCGGPAKIDKGDANVLEASREDLDDAIRTEEALRTDPAEARRLVRELTRRLGISVSVLERFKTGNPRLDKELQRGAAIGAVQSIEELVPSLVVGRTDRGGVIGLDEDAIRDFSRYARSDPSRALYGSAKEEVGTIVSAIKGADPDSEISTLHGQTAAAYLRQAERNIRPIWPKLARRLAAARAAL
jgi:hypothetical protein